MKEEPFGISFNLTSFEEYQIREELSEDANIRFLKNPMDTYELVVPQKGRAYRLNAAALTACREAIRAEAGDKAVFRDGKLFLDGRETDFFFFNQDYYWRLYSGCGRFASDSFRLFLSVPLQIGRVCSIVVPGPGRLKKYIQVA